MGQIIETCKSCGSQELRWEPDNGWITRPLRYLRCQRCHYAVRAELPAWGWAMYGIALAAAVAGWWAVSG